MEQLSYKKSLKISKPTSIKSKKGLGLISTNIMRLLLWIWSVVVLFPLIWTLYTSLKDNKAFYANVWALPKVLHFENYYNAWVTSHFANYFLNSLIVVSGSLLITLTISSMASYVLTKFKFYGSKFLLMFFLAGTMIPTMVSFIPLFFFAQDTLHITGKLSGLILVYSFTSSGLSFSIFLIYGFMKKIPDALTEAATIDGCSYYSTFFKIILPLSKPGLIIAGIMSGMVFWNEYVVAITFLNDEKMYTVPVGISNLAGQMQYRTDFGALFAGLIIGIVPVLVLYIIFQKQLQNGMAVGSGVKG